MTAQSKHKIIRVGDYVKIITSKFIKRVGYPLIWTDLIDEVEKDPRTLAAWDLLTRPQACEVPANNDLRIVFKSSNHIPFEFIKAVAKERVREMGFGGRERQLIYKKTMTQGVDTVFGKLWIPTEDAAPDCTDQVMQVCGKKLAKTGTYYGPVGAGSFNDDYDYEPGGLDNCKTHILLETNTGWIEACNVELIKRAPGSSDKYPAHSRYAPGSKIS